MHVNSDYQMKTWGFSCTILEQFGHVSSIFGACNLGAKFVYVCVEEIFKFFVMVEQSRSSIMRL